MTKEKNIQQYVDEYGPKFYNESTDGHDHFISNIEKFLNELFEEVTFCIKHWPECPVDIIVKNYSNKYDAIIDRFVVLYGPSPIKRGTFEEYCNKRIKREKESNAE